MHSKSFKIKYFLEVLAQRKIFKEKNPIILFVLGGEDDSISFEEKSEVVLEKIKIFIPGWIQSIHLIVLGYLHG